MEAYSELLTAINSSPALQLSDIPAKDVAADIALGYTSDTCYADLSTHSTTTTTTFAGATTLPTSTATATTMTTSTVATPAVLLTMRGMRMAPSTRFSTAHSYSSRGTRAIETGPALISEVSGNRTRRRSRQHPHTMRRSPRPARRLGHLARPG